MKITLSQLEAAQACKPQLAIFKALYGTSVEVTVEECVKAYDTFHWYWAYDKLLSLKQREVYAKACDGAGEAYEEACAAAWKVWKVYAKACDGAGEAYDEARDEARKVYAKVCAAAFADAYNSEP